MVVQVNGKVRAKMMVPAAADNNAIESLARSQQNVSRFLDGLSVRKVIVVPGKLVNIVADAN
jgi:leucyl-tRNA synthetase